MRIVQFVLVAIVAIVALLGIGFAYFYFRGPEMASASNIVVDKSPARLARGKYIFQNLADCEGCHSQRDFSRLYGPVIESGRGQGGELPVAGLPGRVYAPNITPDVETGIGSWTDGEKIRAIREGVDKNGRVLFPMMPYEGFRNMSDEDVQSVVAYIDTLPPVRNAVPTTKIDFPVSMMITGVPRPVGKVVPPPKMDNPAVYGQYLATMAGCEVCHTPQVRGQPDVARRFAGGQVFTLPFGTVVTANITPDKDTGIGNWDYARFRDRLRIFRTIGSVDALPKIGPERFTLMPYIGFSDLTDQDLQALYAYLQTRTPVSQKVDPHPGAPKTDN